MTHNPKSAAWDHVGGMFWELGRRSAMPDAWTIDFLLRGLAPAASVLVVGASTRELVSRSLARGHRVTVFDFSARMCEDLRRSLREDGLTVGCVDVTAPAADDRPCFDTALSDRLLNRFTWEEAAQALARMAGLVVAGGTVRTTLKLGLYPMDERLIECARAAGRAREVFDPDTRTIDFAAASAAGGVLERALLPHGEIPQETLLAWYRGRGRERRFGPGDVERLVAGIDRLGCVRPTTSPGQQDVHCYEIDVCASRAKAQ